VVRTGGGKSNLTEHKFYVGNAVITKRSNSSSDIFYLHKDHQRSTTSITNKSGTVVQQFIYDPWGKQTAAFENNVFGTYVSPAKSKGYTGHEHVSHLDIIHMNGRIYDSTLGRFLQADPHIQAPLNSQNYNRYSYVLNNPMSYTDPSGYFFKSLFKGIKKYWQVIAAAVVTYFTAGAAAGWAAGWGFTGAAAGAVTGAIAGAAGGFVATGSLKGALTGAFSGAVFGAIGASFNGEAGSGFFAEGGIGHIGSHALSGGIMSDLQGGKFGHGFFSAGLTKGLNVNGMIESFGTAYDAARIAVAAIIGGTVSKITGGKFGNGAVSSAMGQMFNGNSQIKGGRNNPIGYKSSGSMPMKMGDGKYYWVDKETFGQNFGSDYLAKQTGTSMAYYDENTK
jgi:RHS repeat-associated protein